VGLVATAGLTSCRARSRARCSQGPAAAEVEAEAAAVLVRALRYVVCRRLLLMGMEPAVP
jgi:hypothetical protein